MEQRNGGYYDPDAHPGDYRIQLAPCSITGERDKVITVLTKIIDLEVEGCDPQSIQVWQSYGAEGLQRMARILAEAPFPVEIPTSDEIRMNLTYYWKAIYPDGTEVNQWPDEKHFGDLWPHRVQRFFLLPKDEQSDLPCYCLDRQEGFLRAERRGLNFLPMLDPYTGVALPLPDVPFHLEYCFTPAVTLAMGAFGSSELFPTRVRQELGWRVDTLHGDAHETLFKIAIEDEDGSWQIFKKEPLASRYFGGTQEDEEDEVDDDEGDEDEDGDGSNPAVLPVYPGAPPDMPALPVETEEEYQNRVIHGEVRIVDFDLAAV